MTEDETNALLREVEQMSYEEMARKWRCAPLGGSPYFQTGPVYDAFAARFASFGGWTPVISKRIGWGC